MGLFTRSLRLGASLRRPLPSLFHPGSASPGPPPADVPARLQLSVRGLRNFPIRVLCRNQKFLRKAGGGGSYYEIEREWNLGIVLQPSEVKSLRDCRADLSAAFGEFYKHEVFLHQLTIPVWRHGLIGRPEPTRVRKLLANRSELKKLEAFASRPNAQLIPMRIEVGKTGWLKVIMAACYKRGQVDNRKRDAEREVKRQLRDW